MVSVLTQRTDCQQTCMNDQLKSGRHHFLGNLTLYSRHVLGVNMILLAGRAEGKKILVPFYPFEN